MKKIDFNNLSAIQGGSCDSAFGVSLGTIAGFVCFGGVGLLACCILAVAYQTTQCK